MNVYLKRETGRDLSITKILGHPTSFRTCAMKGFHSMRVLFPHLIYYKENVQSTKQENPGLQRKSQQFSSPLKKPISHTSAPLYI